MGDVVTKEIRMQNNNPSALNLKKRVADQVKKAVTAEFIKMHGFEVQDSGPLECRIRVKTQVNGTRYYIVKVSEEL